MKLAFLAKAGLVCHWPAAVRQTGQIYNYVGRTWDAASRVHKANAEPVAIDDEHQDADTRVRAERLKQLVTRDGSLWPADEATARACGVEFVPVEMKDGEWQPKAAAAPKTSKPKE